MVELTQNISWDGDTMITQVISKIAGDMAKEREVEILNHFETDFSELREFLEAKRHGLDLVPVVRCRDCKHRSKNTPDGFHWCKEHDHGWLCDDDFCSSGERKDQS